MAKAWDATIPLLSDELMCDPVMIEKTARFMTDETVRIKEMREKWHQSKRKSPEKQDLDKLEDKGMPL